MAEDVWEQVKTSPHLPALPAVAARVLHLSQDSSLSVARLAEVISEDPTLGSKLVQAVNTLYYGRPGQARDLSEAVTVLGLVPLKFLVLSFSLLKCLQKASSSDESFDSSAYLCSGLTSAVTARLLAKRCRFRHAEEAFLAALLRDIGSFALATCLPRDYERVRETALEHHTTVLETELDILGTNHAEIGGHLAEHWGLPEILAQPIRFHHDPEAMGQMPSEIAIITNIVHVADLGARLFCDPAGDTLIRPLIREADRRLGLTADAVYEELQTAENQAGTTAELLAVDMAGLEPHADVLERAHAALGELAIANTARSEPPEHELSRTSNDIGTILAAEISRASRYQRPLGIALVALDAITGGWQAWGRQLSAAATTELASVLLAGGRSTDAAIPGGEPGSVIVCLPGCSAEAMKQKADAYRQAVAAHEFREAGGHAHLTCCVAAISYGQFEARHSPGSVLQTLKRILRRAKERGNGTVLFTRV